MKPKLILCLALVLSGGLIGIAQQFTNSPALTNSEQNFKSLVKLVEQKRFYPALDFYWQQKGIFSQDQRETVFLLAAKMLVTTNDAKLNIGEVNEDSLAFLNNLVENVYFTVQDGVTYRDYGITNSEAIPYLIAALTDVKNGDSRLVHTDSELIIQILNRLTGRNTGFVNGNDHFFATNYLAVTDWWQDWWRQNKNRHPVFDVALEEILRNEILKLDEKIMNAKPTPYFGWDSTTRFELENNISLYSGRVDGPPNSAFTFYYGHSPGSGAKGGGYAPDWGDDVLCVRGKFLTRDLFLKDEPPYGTLFHKKFPMQEIFSETVAGTGIAIKVQIATTNTALINVLRNELNKLK